MAKQIDGRVVKAIASKFFVDTGADVKPCFARKKLKFDGNIFVGDFVKIQKDRDVFVIEEIKRRKNQLIRPYVSNIDICLIVIAPEPSPDFVLVDKIIVNCHQQCIRPILVKNKCDIEQIDTSEYNGVVDIIECSAETGQGIDEILQKSLGKTICFAGQSAVGKSSIINNMLKSDVLKVGELTRKIKRGKHTTRQTEIINIGGTYLVDTCGFSMLDTIDIDENDLRLYFDEFEEYRNDCKFATCTHTNEPDCAVKQHIGKEIGTNRYERYLTIFEELKDRRKNKYD